MSLDALLQRHPNQFYNCAHFASDVWKQLTGEDISHKLGESFATGARRFRELERPESPCLAVMQRRFTVPHIGVYIDGRICHLTETGAKIERVSVAMLSFSTVRFYK